MMASIGVTTLTLQLRENSDRLILRGRAQSTCSRFATTFCCLESYSSRSLPVSEAAVAPPLVSPDPAKGAADRSQSTSAVVRPAGSVEAAIEKV